MSALPRKVQEQVDRANQIVDQVYGKDGRINDDEPAKEPVKDTDVAPDNPEKPVDTSKEQPAKEPAKDHDVTADAEPDSDHKYKVLQGKYNAEVPRLKRQNDKLEADNAELKQRLLNLEGMIAAMQTRDAEPPKPKDDPLPVISDDERAQFGDDLIDLMERVAKRATLPEIEAHLKPLEGRVKQVGEKVAHTETSVAESKRQQVFDRLASAVPDWVQQNEDPKFLEWLDQEEGMSGKTRGHFLTEAMKSNDAGKVIRYFTGFRSENAADTSDPAPAEAPQTGEPKKPEPQAKLDEFVAPGTPKTGTASAPDESGKRVWSREDIAKFYAEKNEFARKGKPVPKRFQELERDLFAAQHEGRLR